jgi:hypothetical protein
MTQDEIAAETGWSIRTVNATLCALSPRYVRHEKVRIKGRAKVTKYFYKGA